MVKAKLDATSYETLRDVCNDLGQIFNNAKRCEWYDSRRHCAKARTP